MQLSSFENSMRRILIAGECLTQRWRKENSVKHLLLMLVTLMSTTGMAGQGRLAESVAAVAATNALSTWEGQYSFRCVAQLEGHSSATNLFLCLYGREGCEGTLLEIYRQASPAPRKVLAAAENVKGVTPVAIQCGVCTNQVSATYWSSWRHPGTGGLLSYLRYSISYDDFVVSAHYEYCDIGDGRRWHVLSGDDVYVAVTNVDRSADIALWTNTNTLYSTAAQ